MDRATNALGGPGSHSAGHNLKSMFFPARRGAPARFRTEWSQIPACCEHRFGLRLILPLANYRPDFGAPSGSPVLTREYMFHVISVRLLHVRIAIKLVAVLQREPLQILVGALALQLHKFVWQQ